MLNNFLKASVFSLGLGLVWQGPVLSANIGFFNNDPYTAPNISENLKNVLIGLGHTVNEFQSLEASDWQQVAQENELIVLGPLDENPLNDIDLGLDLSSETVNVIRNYVAGGGGFILTGGEDETYTFFDRVFGISGLEVDFWGNEYNLNSGNAAGTVFAGGPSILQPASVLGVSIASLPSGAKNIYDNEMNSSALFVTQYGAGKIAYLGFDFREITDEPLWEDVTNLAVEYVAGTPALPVPTAVPEPSVLIGLITIGLSASFIRVQSKG